MKHRLLWLILTIFCLCPFLTVQGAPLDVIISEIAWMGTTVSANDEWIELFNNAQNAIDLDGWVLKADDGTPEIKLTGVIPANGFYLLERTDDNTVSNVPADQIYKGALGNSGEDLKLFDGSGNSVDEANCFSGWFGGDNTIKQTMERIGQNWQTSQNPSGTPKAKNSSGSQQASTATPTPSPMPSSTPAPTTSAKPELKTYPSGIVFSEFLPSPEGADEAEEWAEIQNQNSFEVDLSDWKIEDTIGKTTFYLFPSGAKISQNGYLVLKRPETKITLNNSGDGLNLFSPDGKIEDSVSFEKAPLGQSYGRTSSGWNWSVSLTPGLPNIISGKEEKIKISPNPTPNEETFVVELPLKKETAAVSAAAVQPPKNLLPLLISILLALILAVFIFLLKKSLTKNP